MIMILSDMITILISKTMLRMVRLGLAFTLLVAAAACAGAGEDDERLHIVATTSIWGDVVGQIVGDDATVEVLIPLGADAHDYEPTSQQVAALQAADLVVANGLGLEEGLEDVLEAAADDGANIFEVASELDPLPFATPHEHDEHEDGDDHDEEDRDDHGDHDHGDHDPHVWFDLTRIDIAAGLIAQQLSAIDATIDWASRALDYSSELLSTDEEILRTLDVVADEDRILVTNHEALGYFAARYGFEVIGVVVPGGSTLGDPSSAELAALVEEMEHEEVRVIFAETTQPTRLAEAVAAEVGDDVEVVELYTESLGEPGSGAETLTEMILTNANLVADALSR